MPGARIVIEDRELRQALAELARLGARPEAPLKTIGERLIATTRQRARRAIAPDGSRWPLLNPDYAAGKRGTPLSESGRLLGELTKEVSGSRLRVGSQAKYAAIHHFGGTIVPRNARALTFFLGGRLVRARKVTIPARPWLGISDADREEILAVFGAHIRRATAQR